MDLLNPIFCCNFAVAIKNSDGEMPEWSIGAVSKTVVPFRYPGFESLSLRQENSPFLPIKWKGRIFILFYQKYLLTLPTA